MSGPVHSDRQESIAPARTTRPSLPRIIVRDRCLATLREAEDRKIVYISGRAGQGKTTLALSWLQETRLKAVWLTLDEGDNDPVGFFRLIAGGFAAAFPRNAFPPIPIPTRAPFEPTAFARTYFTTLFTHVSGRYLLVLEDFHSLSADGSIYPIVEALVDALPPKVQIVILSRCTPPGFMARWIAARQLFHVPEETLRFSVAEARALFKNVLDVPITRRQAEALHKRTEGWVTGLILLQEQVRRRSESVGPAPIGPRTPEGHLVDCIDNYMFHEIYQRLDPPVRDLMVRTSLFDSFSLESACDVAKHPDVERRLRCVADRHLVSEIPVRDTLRYRYPPLLRQFLQARVRDLPDGERLELIEWVGMMLEAEGKVDRAIDLYLAHGQDDRAIRLIEKVGLTYLVEGRRMKVCQWVRSLPAAQIGRRPWLLHFLAAAQEFTAPQASEEAYHQALKGFEADGDTEGQIWTLSSLIVLRWHAGPDYRSLEGYAKQGRELFRRSEDACSSIVRATFMLAEAISAIYAAGHLQRGLRKALNAAELARRSGITPLYVQALVYGGRFAVYAGKLRLSSVLFVQAEEVIPWKSLDPALHAQALCYRGIAESFRGEAAKSLASMIEAERVCLDYGLVSLLPLAQANLARQRVVARECNDESVSRPVSEPVSIEPVRRRISRGGNGYCASFLAYSEALHALREGQLSRALTCAEESVRLMQRCRSPFMVHVPRYLLGAILGEMGEIPPAERHLVRALNGFEKAGSALFAFWALLHLAKLALDHGDGKLARARLAAALRVGKTEGYTEGDGLTPRMMSLLLNRARQWKLEPDYVGALMAHWNVAPLASLKMYTLGRFEVELHGRSLPDEAWRGRRLKQVLAALITCGGRQVPKEAIIDLLWPEADGARAVTNFHTTLHRLQAALGHPSANGAGFIRVEGGLVSLDPVQCWVDCCAFEEAVRRAKGFEASGRKSEAQRALHEAGDLYRGEYLPTLCHEVWTEARRQALHRQFLWVEQRLNTEE